VEDVGVGDFGLGFGCAVVFVGVVVEGVWAGGFEMGDGRCRNSGL